MAHTPATSMSGGHPSETRRDFLYLLTGATAAVGAGAMAVPLIDSMNPGADVLATASIEVDLADIKPGMAITVKWRGKPVFIRRRTAKEIERAAAASLDDLRDPEPDTARVQRAEWLVVVGVCTHLGCIPLGQKSGDPKGDFGGWFCACHGSHYDESGRIRKGPAPRNLDVPAYTFLDNEQLRVG